MAFTGTAIYDDTDWIVELEFNDTTQLTAFYAAYIPSGFCRFVAPPIDLFMYFHYDTNAHYTTDKAFIAGILAAL